jgi:glycosyltransferase involved in cell wall biosynthesis
LNILIVTYTYPPSKAVNGFRPYHFAKALVKGGHQVHVLSRHFEDAGVYDDVENPVKIPFAIVQEDEVIVYRTPFRNSWFGYKRNKLMQSTGAWKVMYLIQLMSGRTTQESYNEYFKPYLGKLLATNQYDLILVESGPTNLVRIVSKLARQYHIPYAIDFRDVYYHDMCRVDQKMVSWMNRVKIYLERHYMKSSIAHSLFCISLSDTLHDILQVPGDKRERIINGYDDMVWNSIQAPKSDHQFRIVIGGKLYDLEFLQQFLQSIRYFLNKQLPDVEVLFIAPGNAGMIQRIKSELSDQNVWVIHDRMTLQDTLTAISSAEVLMYHGWKGYRGVTSTKIYDYIRSGKHILIVPGDQDVIDQLLNELHVGKAIDDPELAAHQLVDWYDQWAKHEGSQRDIHQEKLASYSRTYQSELLNRIVNRRMKRDTDEVVA